MPFRLWVTVPIDVKEQNIDMLSLSGHKFHGPKGVGALYVRKGGIPLVNIIEGGAQERGKRAGTENVPCHLRVWPLPWRRPATTIEEHAA